MLARLPELVGRAREGMVMECSAFSTEDHPESVDGGVVGVGVGVVAARVLAANRSQVRFIFLGGYSNSEVEGILLYSELCGDGYAALHIRIY